MIFLLGSHLVVDARHALPVIEVVGAPYEGVAHRVLVVVARLVRFRVRVRVKVRDGVRVRIRIRVRVRVSPPSRGCRGCRARRPRPSPSAPPWAAGRGR